MESYQFEKQPAGQVRYAGFWIRFAAYLLDSIIISIPTGILVVILMVVGFGTMGAFSDPAAFENGDEQAIFAFIGVYLLIMGLSLIITVAYFAGMHSSKWQATVGKKLLKLKVTDLNGNRISFWRALGRLLAMILSGMIFYIGYIMAGFTGKKQALHDLIAGTVVIYED